MLTLRLGIQPSKNNKLLTLSVANGNRSLCNNIHPTRRLSTIQRSCLAQQDPKCTGTMVRRTLLPNPQYGRLPLPPPLQTITLVSRRSLSVWTIPKLLLSGQKFTIWTIPKYLLTGKLNGTKNKKHRNWLLGAFGVATFLSSIFGPVVWVAVGGTASIVCWRLFKKAQKWWTYLTPMTMTATGLLKEGSDKLTGAAAAAAATATTAHNANNAPTMTDRLLSQIGTHYAAELVRKDVIQKLQHYFTKTEQGRSILQQVFQIDQEATDNSNNVSNSQLDWEDVSRSEVVRLTNNHQMHRVSVHFWVKKGADQGCEVKASAIVSDEGKLDIEEVRLSSSEWNKDEIIPVS